MVGLRANIFRVPNRCCCMGNSTKAVLAMLLRKADGHVAQRNIVALAFVRTLLIVENLQVNAFLAMKLPVALISLACFPGVTAQSLEQRHILKQPNMYSARGWTGTAT